MRNAERITKQRFYNMGGFSNPRLVRVMSGKRWTYYRLYA
jgi:hypothetical protein